MNRKLTKEEEMMSYEGYDPILPGPGMLLEEIPIPKPRPKRVTSEDQEKLRKLIKSTTGYKSGGMIDRAAIKGKTKGKVC